MQQIAILSALMIAVLVPTQSAHGDFFVIKRFFGGGQQTWSAPDGVPFTVEVSGTVESVTIFSNALNPATEDLGRVTIQRTSATNQQIWIYIVVDGNPSPGDAHYPLSQAAWRHWNGLVSSDLGEGGLLVRAVIAGNLTDLVHAPDGQAIGGVMNLRAGGNVGGAIVSGSQGTCRVRAEGSVAGSASNQVIESEGAIAEVIAVTGDIRANISALDGAIGVVSAGGNIGTVPPASIVHQIGATSGIGSITSGGSVSANITANGAIGAFDCGSDYRGTMSLSGFDAFRIRRDLLSTGIINLTGSLPANRVVEIDRSTIAGSQINIASSAGLLGQIEVHRGLVRSRDHRVRLRVRDTPWHPTMQA